MLSLPDSTLVTFKNEFSCNITIITADMAYIGMLPVFWMVTNIVKNDSSSIGFFFVHWIIPFDMYFSSVGLMQN